LLYRTVDTTQQLVTFDVPRPNSTKNVGGGGGGALEEEEEEGGTAYRHPPYAIATYQKVRRV
jgi:hypothetical protein